MTKREDDIVKSIGEVTGPDRDAATWIAQAEEFDWDLLIAKYLGIDISHEVELNHATAHDDIAQRLDIPTVDLVERVGNVAMWGNGQSATDSPSNWPAACFLRSLLHSIVDGDYVAANSSMQTYAQDRLAREHETPTPFHGTFMVTGIDGAGEPAPLDHNFVIWDDAQEALVAGECQVNLARQALGEAGITLSHSGAGCAACVDFQLE